MPTRSLHNLLHKRDGRAGAVRVAIQKANRSRVHPKNQQGNLGEWYLDRFGKPALALGPIVAESFRNSGVSATAHYLYIVCTNS